MTIPCMHEKPGFGICHPQTPVDEIWLAMQEYQR